MGTSWLYYIRIEHDLVYSPTFYLVAANKKGMRWTEDKKKATKFAAKDLGRMKDFIMAAGMRFMGQEKTHKYDWEADKGPLEKEGEVGNDV